MTLSKDKIALIHVAKSRLGLTEEDYRAVLRNIAAVGSAKDLDETGFDLVMRHFQTLGFRSDWNKQNLGYRQAMASPGQVALVRSLWHDYTNGQGTDASLGKWLDGRFKISSIRFLPSTAARKAIGALQKMNAKRATTAAASPRPAA